MSFSLRIPPFLMLVGVLACGGGSPSGLVTSRTLEIVSGDHQRGVVNAPLPEPLVVRALSPDSTPLVGRNVSWRSRSAGTFDPAVSITDSNGVATTRWTLDSVTPKQVAVASLRQVTVVFSANVLGRLLVVSPQSDTEAAPGGQAHFIAADQLGVPITGVTWRSLDPTVASVARNGTATVLATGTARIQASIGDQFDTVLVSLVTPGYEIQITDLGMQDGIRAEGLGVNDGGTVVGDVGYVTRTLAARWIKGGAEATYAGIGSSQLLAINNAGSAVGEMDQFVGRRDAVLIAADGTIVPIPGIFSDAGEFTIAQDINSNGVVVGHTQSGDSIAAFRWTAAGGTQRLGGPGRASAHTIADDAQTFGVDYAPTGFLCARLAPGSTADLTSGDCDPTASRKGGSFVYNIAGSKPALERAFLYETTGSTPIPAPAGGGNDAFGVNEAGDVVGRAHFASGPDRAFYWHRADGRLIDLGTLNGKSSAAYSLSNTGYIAGWSLLLNGEQHAVRWKIRFLP